MTDRSTAVIRGAGSADPGGWPTWLAVRLVAPGVVALGAGGLLEAGVLSGAAAAVLRPVIAVGVLLVGVAGTLALWDAAIAERERSGEWRPDPRRYVGGGAAVLTLVGLAVARPTGGSDLLAVLAGGAIVAVLVSSIVAGPAFLIQRRRHC